MDKIRIKPFSLFVLKYALCFCPIVQVIGGLIVNYLEQDKKFGKMILIIFVVFAIIQIPTIIFLLKRLSKRQDVIIDGNDFIQNDAVIFSKKDIVSIERISQIQVNFKYNVNGNESVIFLALSKKKLDSIKQMLYID
ncbi:MAG: hypothetical protein IJV94_04655 [Bacilli bacterium]|nr:hypothetical protein [Bacilli bacterium]